jgi:hypothetical protein
MTHTCSRCNQQLRWVALHAITRDRRVLCETCAPAVEWADVVAVGDAYLATRLVCPETTT